MDIEFKQAKDIETIVNEAWNLIVSAKWKAVSEINRLNTNILLSNEEKREKIFDVQKTYEQNKRRYELSAYESLIENNARVEAKLKQIEADIAKVQEEKKKSLNEWIVDWSVWSKTHVEIADLEKQAGLKPWSLEWVVYNKVSWDIWVLLKTLLWSDFTISWTDFSNLVNSVIALNKLWRPISEAVRDVIKPFLDKNPEYIKIKKQKEDAARLKIEKEQSDIDKTKAEIKKISSDITLDEFKANTDRMKLDNDRYTFSKDADWNLISLNKNTWTSKKVDTSTYTKSLTSQWLRIMPQYKAWADLW
jgi:hypothetical protein